MARKRSVGAAGNASACCAAQTGGKHVSRAVTIGRAVPSRLQREGERIDHGHYLPLGKATCWTGTGVDA